MSISAAGGNSPVKNVSVRCRKLENVCREDWELCDISWWHASAHINPRRGWSYITFRVPAPRRTTHRPRRRRSRDVQLGACRLLMLWLVLLLSLAVAALWCGRRERREKERGRAGLTVGPADVLSSSIRLHDDRTWFTTTSYTLYSSADGVTSWPKRTCYAER